MFGASGHFQAGNTGIGYCVPQETGGAPRCCCGWRATRCCRSSGRTSAAEVFCGRARNKNNLRSCLHSSRDLRRINRRYRSVGRALPAVMEPPMPKPSAPLQRCSQCAVPSRSVALLLRGPRAQGDTCVGLSWKPYVPPRGRRYLTNPGDKLKLGLFLSYCFCLGRGWLPALECFSGREGYIYLRSYTVRIDPITCFLFVLHCIRHCIVPGT